MLSLKFLGKFRDLGLFVLRAGIGIMFIIHGSGKMFGGPAEWSKIGQAMGSLGITAMPVFWGFMAAFAEFVGGFMFIIGFLFRPFAAMLTFTMVVATAMHFSKGDSFNAYSHAVELGFVFFGLMFIGPGKFSIDRD
ncbi:MAG: DoxX family protein [Oligoflexia bacterium]|nr:DoxX family protein [Oligoflexia bacterium]